MAYRIKRFSVNGDKIVVNNSELSDFMNKARVIEQRVNPGNNVKV